MTGEGDHTGGLALPGKILDLSCSGDMGVPYAKK